MIRADDRRESDGRGVESIALLAGVARVTVLQYEAGLRPDTRRSREAERGSRTSWHLARRPGPSRLTRPALGTRRRLSGCGAPRPDEESGPVQTPGLMRYV